MRNGAISSPGAKLLGAVSQGSADSPRAREPGRWPNRETEAKEYPKPKKQPLHLRGCSWNKIPAMNTPKKVGRGGRT